MKVDFVLQKITPSFLILIFALICFFSQFFSSVTVDEFAHLPSGIYNLLTLDWRMNNESPPLIKCYVALSSIFTQPKIDYGAFEKNPNTWRMGYSFMSLNKAKYQLIFQYGRLMIIILGCFLGGLIYLWAKGIYDHKGALFALFLYLFNPNILAHSSLITIDIGASCAIFASIYCFWKYLMKRNNELLVIAGLVLGLAQLAKFTALLLYPIFFIIIILIIFLTNDNHDASEILVDSNKRTTHLVSGFCIIILISITIINLGYFFSGSFKQLSDYHFSSTLFKISSSFLWTKFPVPLPYDYITGLDTQLIIAEGNNPFYASYLMGQHSLTGWWYYYWVAFFVKNPLPLLVILPFTVCLWLFDREKNTDRTTIFCIWIPIVSYLIYFSFFTHIFIGIRDILPIFPLLFLACGRLFNGFIIKKKIIGILTLILAVSYLFSAVYVFPNYLSFFNSASGGSQNGYRWLIDSNIDWGQGLPELKNYMENNHISKIKLGYFGRVDPQIYGIDYSLAEKHPTEGIYAISINFLMGRPYYLLKEETWELLDADFDYFDKYRLLKPSAIIDNSIWIFDVKR